MTTSAGDSRVRPGAVVLPARLSGPSPVFAEPTGRRWRLLQLGALLAVLALGALLAWQLAPVAQMLRRPLPGPTPESVVRTLGAKPPILGSGPLVRLVEVRDGQAVDPFTRLTLASLQPDELAQVGTARYAVQRYGYGAGTNEISMTFDDGPDPAWTPKLLDVLAQHHIKATFFVTGKAAAAYPDLVRRIVREGHALGNHSLSHVNVSDVPSWRADLELAGNSHLLAQIAGQDVTFVRPPYDGGAKGNAVIEALAIARAQRAGYVVASYDHDTHDWMYGGGTGDGALVGSLPEHIALPTLDGRNLTVLMHDAGGDRSHTIEYVRDSLVPAALAAGYTFTTMPEASPSFIAPTTTATDRHSAVNTAVSQLVWAWLVFPNKLIDGLFILAVVSVAAIGGTFAVLALLRRARRRTPPRREDDDATPPITVSVVIAAYNEATVIAQTLRSLVASRYPVAEFLVVDDGSTDDTARIVQELARDLDPRIRLIQQENGKKPAALNRALRSTRSQVVVTVDADTHADPDMVANLVRHFEADVYGTLSAVAGVVRVGNGSQNMLTRWQALEYLTQIGVERAAHDLLGAIAIVPGACAAWRREAVLAAGGFSHATLAEDADLTLSLHRMGWRVTQDDEAFADTEAPEDVDSLLKQRVRWTYGTLQAMAKHHDMVLRPRYGWLGMLVMPWAVLSLAVPLLTIPFVGILSFLAFTSQGPGMLGGFYLVFTAAQLFNAVVAVLLLRQPAVHLLMVPAYRLMYEPMRAYLLYRSVYLAARGVSVGWNKLLRTGSVGRAHPGVEAVPPQRTALEASGDGSTPGAPVTTPRLPSQRPAPSSDRPLPSGKGRA